MAGAVGRRGDEVVPHDGPHVALAHAEVDGLRAAVALDVEHDFQRRGAFCLRDGGQVATHPAGLRRVPGDPDRGSSVTPVELALDLDAEQRSAVGRIGQPGELVSIAPDRPVRNHHRGELGARGDVRVLIGRDMLPGIPGRGDSLERGSCFPPVGLAVGLQMRDMDRHPADLPIAIASSMASSRALFLVADVRGVDPPEPATTLASSVSSAVLA